MDPVSVTVGLGWSIAGLICLGLSIPLMRGRVGRNRVYGVRFSQSFQSDEAWAAINRFGGKRLAVLVGSSDPRRPRLVPLAAAVQHWPDAGARLRAARLRSHPGS